MYAQRLPNVDLAVISLDPEMTFDQVEWSYLFKALQKCNIGDGVINWIQLLYRNPCGVGEYSLTNHCRPDLTFTEGQGRVVRCRLCSSL